MDSPHLIVIIAFAPTVPFQDGPLGVVKIDLRERLPQPLAVLADRSVLGSFMGFYSSLNQSEREGTLLKYLLFIPLQQEVVHWFLRSDYVCFGLIHRFLVW